MTDEVSRTFDDYLLEQYPGVVAELDYLLGDLDLARETAQEAFARQYAAWDRLSGYDKPGAWVRRVALRLAFRMRKRLSRHVDWDAVPEAPARAADPDAVMDVRRAILQLSNAQRSTIVYRYYCDLPDEEIAQIMGVKEPTVRSHLSQARERLAGILAVYSSRFRDG